MITQKKIAESLGIAPNTVSNILSGNPGYRYSQETRDRVTKAAQEAGYRGNRIARAIRRGRSNLIGIIHFGSSAEVARKTDQRLPRFINAAGYDYLAVDLNWHGGSVDRVIDELVETRVEGVVISHMTQLFGPEYTEMLARVGIPSVVIYGNDRLNVPLICDDTRSSFFAMTRHLQSVGHRRLMLLVNNYRARPERQRMEGFQLAMRNFGPCEVFDDSTYFAKGRSRAPGEGGTILQVDLSKSGYNPTLGYYQAAKQILARREIPEAIICFNDMAAFGVFAAAFEAGLRVPVDLAITGSDNDLFGSFPFYGLTTLEKDLESTCESAIELLIGQMRKGKGKIETRIFPSQLILRQSCGRTISKDELAPAPIPITPIPQSILKSLQIAAIPSKAL